MASLEQLKDAFQNVVFDDEGGFDRRNDRERYIRFLEARITYLHDELDRMQAKLDVIAEDEEIKWLTEHR